MQTHLNDHRSDFEKKWENKIAQLEPGSKEGVSYLVRAAKKRGEELDRSDGE